MIPALLVLLRLAGAGLILLALAHILMGRELRWREEAQRLSLANQSIFHVHTFFVCVMLVLMGLPALLDPRIFIERSGAGAWLAWSCSAFWVLRLVVQWFVFPSSLWRGKRFETIMHIMFTVIWVALIALFTVCGLIQSGRIA